MPAMLPERRRTLAGACRSAYCRASNFPKGRTEAQLEHACEIYHPNRSATAPVERLCRSAPPRQAPRRLQQALARHRAPHGTDYEDFHVISQPDQPWQTSDVSKVEHQCEAPLTSSINDLLTILPRRVRRAGPRIRKRTRSWSLECL